MSAARAGKPAASSPASQPAVKPAVTTDTRLRWLSIALAVVGLVVASYLVYIKFDPNSLLCTGVGDCTSVNTSLYSELMGIPVAAFGAAAFAFLLAVLLLETRSGFAREWGPLLVFGAALAGTLYSAYLTYIELFVIDAICPYCVTSAIAMTLIFVVSIFRLHRYL
jgi:uncharacterized membrane protein